MSVNKPLLNFIIEKELLEKIEDFRFRNRYPTRAAAIKWLLAWALKQKPSPKALPVQMEEAPPPMPPPMPETRIEPEPVVPRVAASEPSRESAIQALSDQGYEVGETVEHPDGKLRIGVRSKDGSGWVNVDQEL